MLASRLHDREKRKRGWLKTHAVAIQILCIASLTLSGSCLAHYVVTAHAHRTHDEAMAGEEHGQTTRTHTPKGTVRLADTSEWLESLRMGTYWAKKPGKVHATPRARRPAQRRARHRESKSRIRSESKVTTSSSSVSFRRPLASSDGTYRTVCVRLCDGFYWPISFATTRKGLKTDSNICARSCDAPAVLYYDSDPEGEPGTMVDREGQPYSALPKAFAYRTTYDASCKCRPHPWEREARQRHQSYADQPPVQAASATK